MALVLSDFATGDTDYISKLNANNAAAKAAVESLQGNAQLVSGKNQPSGYAGLDGGSKLSPSLLPDLGGTYQARSEKATPNGYASLGVDGKVPVTQLPITFTGEVDPSSLETVAHAAATYETIANAATHETSAHAAATYVPLASKGAASGVASLGSDGLVPADQLPPTATGDYVPTSAKGAANGVAELDSGGKVPDAQIPAGIARDSEVTTAITTALAGYTPPGSGGPEPYDLVTFYPGKPGNAAILARVRVPRAVAFSSPAAPPVLGHNGTDVACYAGTYHGPAMLLTLVTAPAQGMTFAKGYIRGKSGNGGSIACVVYARDGGTSKPSTLIAKSAPVACQDGSDSGVVHACAFSGSVSLAPNTQFFIGYAVSNMFWLPAYVSGGGPTYEKNGMTGLSPEAPPDPAPADISTWFGGAYTPGVWVEGDGVILGYADAGAAATGAAVVAFKRNGSTVGSVTYGAGSAVGTLALSGGAFTTAAGDLLTLEAPAVADATLADISITLTGTR